MAPKATGRLAEKSVEASSAAVQGLHSAAVDTGVLVHVHWTESTEVHSVTSQLTS